MWHETACLTDALRERFGARVRNDEPLARHGTFGVGGPAEVWVTLEREDELGWLLEQAAGSGWPLMLIGNGTNVLYADAGARGIVARIALDAWHVDDADSERPLLTAEAGVSLPKLVNELAALGLAGLEWGAGVPGTIGGAVVSNAGAHGASTSETLVSARVAFAPPPGEAVVVHTLNASELDFAYRHSRFRAQRHITFDDDGQPTAAPRAAIEPAEVIVEGTFALRRDDPLLIRQRVASYRQHRRDTQPVQKSAGSVFKNPAGDHAGRLIEAAGLKGARLGKAQLSPKHANFIVNTGDATAADVVGLIALARRTVRQRFGVELELEVELRGDW